MTSEIIVPPLGESISEATVARWLKHEGEYVDADDPVVELETDKVTLEVNAPLSGYIGTILAAEGTVVAVGGRLGTLHMQPETPFPKPSELLDNPSSSQPLERAESSSQGEMPLSPAVRKMVADHQLNPEQIPGSGKDGRITKGDVLNYLEQRPSEISMDRETSPAVPSPEPLREVAQDPPIKTSPVTLSPSESTTPSETPDHTRVRMSRLRQRIAQRLKDAQNTAAILTTFNEVDMTQILSVRERYKEAFEKKHGVRLGIMSFFVKAAVEALKEFPAVNAEIEGEDMIYKNTYHIGVAVGTEQGLVVPVIRHADRLSLAGIERDIAHYADKARQGQLKIEDLTGGTFTISNGGVYGSLMSTPILNPPQSGILGMHKTQKRPVVDEQGHIVVRPMMYVALSYDHRIIDGKEAVSFLVRIKEKTENPERLMLEL